MPEKIQEAASWISQAFTWLWVIGLSSWGGAVGYLSRIDKQKVKFKFYTFCVEVFISAFVGVLTFLLCDSSNLSWETTAAMVGVSGHMGTRALMVIENWKYGSVIKGDDNGNS